MKTLALLAALFALPAFAGNEYADKLDQDLGGAQKLLDDAQSAGQLAKCYPNQQAADISKALADLRAKFGPDANDFVQGANGWKAFLTKAAGPNSEGTDSEFVCQANDQTKQGVAAFDGSLTRAEATFKAYCDDAHAIAKKFDDSFSGHLLSRLGSSCREASSSVKAARKLIQDAAAQACEHFFWNVSTAQDSAHAVHQALDTGCKGVQYEERERQIQEDIRANEHEKYMECYDKSGQTGWGCGEHR